MIPYLSGLQHKFYLLFTGSLWDYAEWMNACSLSKNGCLYETKRGNKNWLEPDVNPKLSKGGNCTEMDYKNDARR